MFSKAGKLHNDRKASQADDLLEHAFLASANCVSELVCSGCRLAERAAYCCLHFALCAVRCAV